MKTTQILGVIAIGFVLMSASECDNTTDSQQAAKTEQLQDRSNSLLGLPNISNFAEKRLVKELYELRDQTKLVTYTYTLSVQTGLFVFQGKSIGFGVPGAVQYSNPERIIQGGSYNTIPQPEPNGLFMPPGMDASWVKLINPITGEESPTYIEQSITVSLYPLPNAVYPPNGPQYADLIAIKKK